MLGATQESELLGQDIKVFVYDETADTVRKRLEILFAGEMVKDPIPRKLVKLDGSVIDVEMHGGLVKYLLPLLFYSWIWIISYKSTINMAK